MFLADHFSIHSKNGLAEELNKCRNSDEYRARGNIFNQDSGVEESARELQPSEPTLVDAGIDIFNSCMSRMLRGLPEMSSFDLSMEMVKSKGQ